MDEHMGAFERDTLHRILAVAARYWVIEHHQRAKQLPKRVTFFAYAEGPAGMDWGNSPGPDDAELRPMRGKRVRITLEIEDG